MAETPQYRVIEPAFFAPDLIPVGTIIATDAPPGPHLEPWNEAAKARMEEWYSTEMDEIDPKTKEKTGKKIRPYAGYRPAPFNPAPQQTAQVLEEPESAAPAGLTLAEIQQRKPTDQRPPPATRFKKTSPVADAPKAATVVEAAPPTTSVKGGPG